MKSIFLIFLACFSIYLFPSKNIKTEDLTLPVSNIASNYVVIERSTNKIIEGNNYHNSRSVASISKIMTTIVAIENANLNDIVTIPEEINKVYGSMLYLNCNDKVILLDLLYGLMLRSGNDAAISIAIHVSGSVDEFVKLMNQKAQILNMNNSYFVNPHGLDEEDGGNISSAYDMAILHAYALNNPIYRNITSSKSYKSYTNKNRLIKSYEYCSGGKTGYTKKAGRTLVSSALKDDLELVVVTLNCGNDFSIHKNIYQYYFSKYMGLICLKSGDNYIDNYCLKVEKEYVFMILISQENNLYLKYEIVNKEVSIYLIDRNGYVLDTIKIVVENSKLIK